MGAILDGRISLPPLPTFAVPRPRLVERLDAAVQGRLSLVVAPLAYGKTFLLREWAHEQRAPLAWVALDATDDDATCLARHLLGALEPLAPHIGEQVPELPGGSRPGLGDAFVRHIVDRLAPLPHAVVVLDDLSALSNATLLQELGALVEQVHPGIHILVSARSLPAWGCHPTVLDASDLAFDRDEAIALVANVSERQLSDAQADVLVARTEGWPAGLQLAAVSLRDERDADVFIDGLAGDDHHIAGYLTAEVVARQPADVRRFLLETAVLDRLSAALCEAVTGGGDAMGMLRRLERHGLFLQPVDEGEGWFRYHGLFRDLLRRQLRSVDPTAEQRLLRRAADWYLAHDDPETAAGYLIDAEDWPRVLGLVDTHTRSMFERGAADVALGWLEVVPAAVRSGRRDIALQRVLLHTMVGSTRIAEQILRDVDTRSMTAGERTVAHVLEATWVQSHLSPERAIDSADAALDALARLGADDVPDVMGVTPRDNLLTTAELARARALWHLGDTDGGRRVMTPLAERAGTYPPLLVDVLGALALLEAWAGRLHVAAHHATRALDLASASGLTTHRSAIDAHVAMASVLRERNRLDDAHLVLDQARACAGRAGRSVPLAIEALERALLFLAMAQPERGLAELDRCGVDDGSTGTGILAARVRASEARLLIAMGEPGRADAVLQSGQDGPWTAPSRSTALLAALARGNVPEARAHLERWPAEAELRPHLERELGTAVVESLEGKRRMAMARTVEVVALAEPEGHARLFLDAGNDTIRLLRAVARSAPSPYVRGLLEPERSWSPSTDLRVGGTEAFSERELEIIRYLPTRLSSAEIAEQLYVSLNTLKTHLGSIYRKLGVRRRSEAIEVAERLGLA